MTASSSKLTGTHTNNTHRSIWKTLAIGYGLFCNPMVVNASLNESNTIGSTPELYSPSCLLPETPVIFPMTTEEKEQKHLEQMNQPITINNLYVKYQPHHSYGEPAFSSRKSNNIIENMVAFIDKLAQFAYDDHEKKYTHEDSNHVTRIVLSEFALYPKDKPFTDIEIGVLLEHIETIAMRYHENIHLALGTIPIGTDEKLLLNTMIYVQCGEIPQISLITKSHPAKNDRNYFGYKLAEKGNENSEAYMLSAASHIKQKTINYHTLILCKTSGGAMFIVGVDICYDHIKQNVKKAYLKTISRVNMFSKYLPSQRNHLIIANSITPEENNLISSIYDQGDPIKIGSYSSFFSNKISSEKIIHEENNPMFGAPFTIVFFSEHGLTLNNDNPLYNHKLESMWSYQIDTANENRMKERTDLLRGRQANA